MHRRYNEPLSSEDDCPNKEGWFKAYWRPAMAWQYFTICLFDFIVFPLLTMWWSHHTGQPYTPWNPITLKEGGFYHLSMGAIVGVTAWTRGQEHLLKHRINADRELYYTEEEMEDPPPAHPSIDE
jgi:hypothetical protein